MNRFGLFLVAIGLSFSSAVRAQGPPEFPGLGPAGTLTTIQVETAGAPLLSGANARRQLVVTGRYSSGQLHDVTRQVNYTLSKPGVVAVDSTGFVSPVANGEVTITATAPGGKTATADLVVSDLDSERAINFSEQIVPILTKLGCNAGGCHGKSDGQNGFKLSLLGFYPHDDYDYLVKENAGRRLFPAAPEFSLLLTKASNQMPHGGGHRLDEDSYEWQVLVSWIKQGMPYGSDDAAKVDRIEVFPEARSMNRDEDQQLSVVAHYTDGTALDVTRVATYESNDSTMAESTTTGLVTAFDVPGDVAVMVRFQGQVTVFRASVPLGINVTALPPERNVVDKHVFGKLKSLGIPPSSLAEDTMFLRRVFLDVTGRLPTAEQAKAFLDDKSPNKRDTLIDYLVNSPGYGDYFANKWSMILRNQRAPDMTQSFKFHDWIRRQIQRNVPYDQFARSILGGVGEVDQHPPVAWYSQVNTPNEQVEDTAQLFLGLRIQCARCHHHPFEKWSQNDYYGFQAFFSRLGTKPNRQGTANARIFHNVGLARARNPRSNKDMKPAGLGGEPLDIPDYEDPRHRLVDWMAAPDNPFFAKALVNRYWKHFFGRGIVDPEDDMRVTNPPSNPELLDALAKSFVDSGFDLKALVTTICQSSAYQLSSEPNEYNMVDKQNFSSFYPRRLNAEPLYDAINQVSNTTVAFAGMPAGTRAVQLPDNGFNDYFLSVFGQPKAESACECERVAEANLAQSLHLLNSTDIQGKLTAGGGRADLLTKADDGRKEADKIEELYLWAYSRYPQAGELTLVSDYVAGKPNKRQAYEDVLWALFNTKEFLFNR